MKNRQRRMISTDVAPDQRSTLDRILTALPRDVSGTPTPAPLELSGLFYHPNSAARVLALTLSAGYDAASARSESADKKLDRAVQVFTLSSGEDAPGRRHLDELRRLLTAEDVAGFLAYIHDSAASFLSRSMDQSMAMPPPAQAIMPRTVEEGEQLPEEQRRSARSVPGRPARTPRSRSSEVRAVDSAGEASGDGDSAGDADSFERSEPREEIAREEAPRGEDSRSDEGQSDRPRSDRPRSDRPRSDRPRSDRPRSDRPRSDEPRAEDGDDRGNTLDRPARAPRSSNDIDDDSAAAAAAALAAIDAPYEDVVEDGQKPRFDPDRDLEPEDARRNRRRRARGPEGLERPRPDQIRDERNPDEPSDEGSPPSGERREPRGPRRDGRGDDRPRGGDRDDRPRGADRDDRPRGGDRDDRPRGGDRDDRPRGGDRDDRPRGGDRESREDRPAAEPRRERDGDRRDDRRGNAEPRDGRDTRISLSRVGSAPELAELALDLLRQALRLARESGLGGRVRVELNLSSVAQAAPVAPQAQAHPPRPAPPSSDVSSADSDSAAPSGEAGAGEGDPQRRRRRRRRRRGEGEG